ncbi:hypothetical protein [Dyadobacter sp. NIV53]|uniref:hypothetical protein n=1 Tax=Dyadobacter sp. NIV53 TaxID=2861765 RepID=UPI001C87CE25|nr:hypothetical protein [Dyadobacter sp. NIV53]
MYPQANIDEEIIKIKTLTIGGRRMTKSVFNQIIRSHPFDREINFVGEKVIGFVNDTDARWLLYIRGDEIRKSSLNDISKLLRVGETTKFEDFEAICRQVPLNYFEPNIYPGSEWQDGRIFAQNYYSEEVWNKILSLTSKAKAFLECVGKLSLVFKTYSL